MNNLSLTENQTLRVSNFQELVATAFSDKLNAICWERKLEGNFEEIIEKLAINENIASISIAQLNELQLSKQARVARQIIIDDIEALEAQGASPTLNVIKHYERDNSYPFFPTDVYSFHVDRSPIPTNTILCTYHGAPSEILPNAQAIQKIGIPEIQDELKKLYNGAEEGFETFLSEYFFDLHYQALPTAQPISLGLGHLWKIAVDHPESKVLPCIHRAPIEQNDEARLLLIC